VVFVADKVERGLLGSGGMHEGSKRVDGAPLRVRVRLLYLNRD
jgi:hypothetical protein